jgi:hypothetical protein
MLDYIEANKIDKLYVNSIIDLGKSLIESLKLYIKIVSKNIKIMSSTEPFLNKDKDLTNELFAWILENNKNIIVLRFYTFSSP